MNTAEKVARLEAYLHRLQENAKLPRPQRRAVPRTDVAAIMGSVSIQEASPAADALRAAAAEMEAVRLHAERSSKEAAEKATREAAEIAAAARAAAENAARDAAERAAKEAAAREAHEKAERAAKEAAAREAHEKAERAAKEKAAKEAAEKAERAAKEKAAKEAAEKAAHEASEKAAKEAAERAAREAAEKAAHEAAEKAAKEKAAHEAAEKAAKEKAAHEAAEKAAKEKAAREAAEKAAKEKAAHEAAEKAAKEKAAHEAAEKAAKEKAAKDAAEKAAKEKAAKDAAEKAAKEKAAREAIEKAAKEKATKEAAERAAKEATERAAKDAAAVPPKKQPATIDELFAELEFSGEPTKVAKGPNDELVAAVRSAIDTSPTPSPKPVQSGPPPIPSTKPAGASPPILSLKNLSSTPPVSRPKESGPPTIPEVRDEPTFDAAEHPTVVGSSADLPLGARHEGEADSRPLPGDAPTRVAAESYAGLLDLPTVEGPTVLISAKPGLDRSPEPDEPTVIRRPTAHDQALVRGELMEESPDEDSATLVRDSAADMPTLQAPVDIPPEAGPILATPIIGVGDRVSTPELRADAGGDGPSSKSTSGLHEPKVELAGALRDAADKAEREAAERAEREAALRPKPERKDGVRDEVTTASRRMVQLTPEAIEDERAARARENKRKGPAGMIGLLVVTILLVGGFVFVGLRAGWFESSGPSAPTSGVTGAPPVTAGTATPTVTATVAPTTKAAVTAAPTASVSSVPTPTNEPAPSGTAAAEASAKPGIAVIEKPADAAKLNQKAFLTVLSSEDDLVYVTGKKLGPVNQRYEVSCGVALLRIGAPLPNGGIEWKSAPGLSISIPCQSAVTIAITPAKGPWPTGGGRPAPGGGTDPY